MLATGILYTSIIFSFNKNIFPNTYVAGIYLGDSSVNQAEDLLQKNLVVPEKLTISADNTKFDIDPKEIKLQYDFSESAKRAYNFSNTGNLLRDAITKTRLVFKPTNLGLALTYDQNKLDETISIISSKLGQEPIYPNVKQTDGKIEVQKGKNGIKVDLVNTKLDLLSSLSLEGRGDSLITFEKVEVELTDEESKIVMERAQKLIDKNVELNLDSEKLIIPTNTILGFLDYGNEFDREKIKEYATEIATKFNRNSQDSIFVVENGIVKEFTPSQDGLVVSEDQLSNLIFDKLIQIENSLEVSASINIPVTTKPAKIKNQDVNNLGINTLLGRGMSHFRGSIANRVYNVNLAQSRFKGTLVPPGEIFSFNQILGDVSSLTGYKSAYVIKDGKTVLGDGGGVCQVSTTLFRAVLAAGLPVVERKPHSYRVGYYEQGFPVGLDATVYYPTTDFKFKNDTAAYLLIQPTIDIPTYTLTFDIYGTNDGRVATTSKPIITSSTAPPADVYVDDPTLPTGKISQIEHKAWGARVVFDYKVIRNGETLIDQKFVSNYRPWQAVYLKGVGPVN